jgi:hypothetical protein
VPRQGHQNEPQGSHAHPNGGQLYATRMGNANRTALSIFMNGLMEAQTQREHLAPPYAPSDIPDLVTDDEPEVTPLSKEGLSASARTWLEQAHTEVAQGQH